MPTDDSPFTLTHTPQWKARFDETYRLSPGEAVRLIDPPFIPERAAFVTLKYNRSGGVGDFPERLTLLYRDELRSRDSGSATLLNILKSMKSYRDPDDLFDCPKPLAKLEVPGDWIVREQATLQERLEGLERIVADRLVRRIRITPGRVDRDAIVVRGRYKFQPLAGAPDDLTINITVSAEPFDLREEFGGGGGEFQDLMAWLSRFLHRRVLDETTGPPPGDLKWRQRESSIANFRLENPPELDAILSNLQKQTSLQFASERRPVDVWTVREEELPK